MSVEINYGVLAKESIDAVCNRLGISNGYTNSISVEAISNHYNKIAAEKGPEAVVSDIQEIVNSIEEYHKLQKEAPKEVVRGAEIDRVEPVVTESALSPEDEELMKEFQDYLRGD